VFGAQEDKKETGEGAKADTKLALKSKSQDI